MRYNNNKAFTLIELIVVMAIIAILVLLAAPRFMGYTKEAQETKIINQVKTKEFVVDEELALHGELPSEWSGIKVDDLETISMYSTLYGKGGEVAELPKDFSYKYIQDESKDDGEYYANSNGDVYYLSKNYTLEVDSNEQFVGGSTGHGAEFVKTIDFAPIFDKYSGEDVIYALEFEARTKHPNPPRNLFVYSQDGEDTKYSFINRNLPVYNEFRKMVVYDFKPSLRDNSKITVAPLSFYGGYHTGNIPIVKNIKLKVFERE